VTFPSILSCRSKFPIALSKNPPFLAFQFLPWGHKPNGTVQSDIVVVIHKFPDDSSGILKGKRHLGPETLPFEHPMPWLNLSIALGVKGA